MPRQRNHPVMTMRALEIGELSGPDGLRLAHREVPEDDSLVLIDVRAAGVGFPDLLVTRGEYQLKGQPPFVPGFEVSGHVRAAAKDSGLEPGRRVMGTAILGAFAEVAAVSPALVTVLPDDVAFERAATLVSNYPTALFALTRRTRIAPGDSVVVLGAAGGLGAAAVAVAKALGAQVVAVTRRRGASDLLRGLGADHVVAGPSSWLGAVRDITGGGADVVVDPVGGETFDDGLRALARYGRVLVLGFASGEIPRLKLNRLLLRNVTAVGVAWGEALSADPCLWGELTGELFELLRSGGLRTPDPIVYPLSEGRQALLDLEAGRVVGKAVLIP